MMKILLACLLFIFISCTSNSPQAAKEPVDGNIVNGERVITLRKPVDKQIITVYRGDKVTLDLPDYNGSLEKLHFTSAPFQIDSSSSEASIQLQFKADEPGEFPIEQNSKTFLTVKVIPYAAPAKATYIELDAAAAYNFIQEKRPLILDVRTDEEYAAGFIKNSLHLPLASLVDELEKIEQYKHKPILLYCRSGNRSTVAAYTLIEHGFTELYNLRTGIIGWAKARLPLVQE